MSLVVVANNIESFTASLKSNLKLGYGICTKIEQVNGFYRAELSKGDDPDYRQKLLNAENLFDICPNAVQNVETQETVEAVVVESVPAIAESIPVTIKRIRKSKAKKGETE